MSVESNRIGKDEPAAAPELPGELAKKVAAGIADPKQAPELRVALWVEGHRQVAEKWDATEGDEAYWKARARRAEAEREAARAIAHGQRLADDARVDVLERRLRDTSATLSWRITEPLRRANARRRRMRAGR